MIVCFVYCDVLANVHLWRRWSGLKHCFLAWCVCWFGSVLMGWWIGCARGCFDGFWGWLCRWVFWWVFGLVVQVGVLMGFGLVVQVGVLMGFWVGCAGGCSTASCLRPWHVIWCDCCCLWGMATKAFGGHVFFHLVMILSVMLPWMQRVFGEVRNLRVSQLGSVSSVATSVAL